MKSIDFVLAFPQADLDVPVFMELPAGVNPVKFWMKIDAVMFSNLIRVYMDLSKRATIGLSSFGRD